MFIRKLQVTDLRVFENLELEPAPGVNLITGENGSGKTTLLEAIYLLGRGKSFRHKDAGPFIRKDAEKCRVLGELEQGQNGKQVRLGIERSTRGIRVRKDGMDLTRRSDLLQTLPIQIITPQSHELVERGPEIRRRFLNYNMFHVEHDYHQQLSDYYKCLKQRNAALRSRDLATARSFNTFLARNGEQLTRQREFYLEKLQNTLTLLLEELDFPFTVEMGLSRGWEKSEPLLEILKSREPQDLKYGFTTSGIHRADLKLQTEGVAAAKRLSRGQQKILVYLLQIAHFHVLSSGEGEPPVFLVDDIAAELDEKNLDKILSKLIDIDVQAFITSTSSIGFRLPASAGMFHVEHGKVQAIGTQ